MIKLDISLLLPTFFWLLVIIVFSVLLTLLVMGFTRLMVKIGLVAKKESSAFSDFCAKIILLLMILFALLYSIQVSNKTYQPLSINNDDLSRELILPWQDCLNSSTPFYLTGHIAQTLPHIYLIYHGSNFPFQNISFKAKTHARAGGF